MGLFLRSKNAPYATAWSVILLILLAVWYPRTMEITKTAPRAFAQLSTVEEGVTPEAAKRTENKGRGWRGFLWDYWCDNSSSLIVTGVLVVTAILILLQIGAIVRTRQQETFTSLVSQLNNIAFYPDSYQPSTMQRMELLGKLHNYLDGVEDILNREHRPRSLSFLKKQKKEITKREKDKLRTLLDKKKTSYYLRALRWYKYVQKYYISLNPQEGEILFHLRKLGAIRDPHSEEDYFAPMQPFNRR